MKKEDIKYLIVHHTSGSDANPLMDTSNQSFEIVDEYHRQKWNFKSSLGHYIGYQYFIDKQGLVTQGRADLEEGAHTIGKNKSSIGCCMAGNFDLTLPTKAQLESLKALLLRLKDKYNVPLENIVPHRHFAQKTCFGRLLTDDFAQKLLIDKPISTSCIDSDRKVEEGRQQIGRLQLLIQNLIKYLK